MRKVIAVLSVLIALSSASARAQVISTELIPFGGYRWSSGISNVGGLSELDVKDAAAYGLALNFNMARNSVAELYWSHWEGDWEAQTLIGDSLRGGSFSRDDFMLQGIWYATNQGRGPARPYITAGLGGSVFYADSDRADTVWRFAWDIGAGVRRDVNEKFGIRADFRWFPTWITTGESVWCDPYWGCYPVSEGEFLDQWELTGGLVIKLGGR